MKNKVSVITAVASVCVLLVSLTVTLLDALIPLSIWDHPVLTLLFCLCCGFGVIALVLGIVKKSPWFTFLSSILLGLAIFYAVAHYVIWWLCLIVVLVFWIIMALVSFLRSGNRTESIALNRDENGNIVKMNYKIDGDKPAEEKELPEIKSFK